MTISPIIKKDYLNQLANDGKRSDGRKMNEYRPVVIETGIIGKAEGSARVKIGNTQVVAGIKMDIGKNNKKINVAEERIIELEEAVESL